MIQGLELLTDLGLTVQISEKGSNIGCRCLQLLVYGYFCELTFDHLGAFVNRWDILGSDAAKALTACLDLGLLTYTKVIVGHQQLALLDLRQFVQVNFRWVLIKSLS